MTRHATERKWMTLNRRPNFSHCLRSARLATWAAWRKETFSRWTTKSTCRSPSTYRRKDASSKLPCQKSSPPTECSQSPPAPPRMLAAELKQPKSHKTLPVLKSIGKRWRNCTSSYWLTSMTGLRVRCTSRPNPSCACCPHPQAQPAKNRSEVVGMSQKREARHIAWPHTSIFQLLLSSNAHFAS